MAKPRGLLTEYEAPWSAPYGTPVMDEAVRSGMQRLRTAGKRSGLKPNDRLFNAALLQDVVMGAGEVVGAPLTGLMAPAMPYVKKAAEFAGRMPSMEAIGPRGGWTGDGGKRPATMGEGVKGLLKTATKGVDKVAEATGYPKEYTREAALAGAGLLAGPASKFAGKAGGLLEKGLNTVGYTSRPAGPNAGVSIKGRDVPVTINKTDERTGMRLVPVRVDKFDSGFARDKSSYVGKGGQGGIDGRYDRFGKFIETAQSVEAPTVSVTKDGLVQFGNGRHRFAYMRDNGAETVPVAMDDESYKAALANGLVDEPYTAGANGGGLIGKADARRVNNNRKKLDAIHPAAISSRLPGVSSPERSAAMSRHLVPGIMAMSRDPEAFAQNVGTLADIPGFGRLRGMDPMKAANMATRQMADNLISIREHMSPEYWNATKVWYPKGAGFVANDHMNRYGLMRQQVAASLANLSPSTLWDLNVEQARRMADMYVNRRGSRMTPTMIDIADTTWDRGAATTPIARGYLEDARRLQSEGKPLDDMLRGGNYKDAALLMQLMDRDVGPKPFPSIYPWGAYGPDYPRQYSPNTVALMKNAVRTMHEPTREVISDTIAPDKHKIRAFYNDILAPEEMPDEVVVDTHQVGASTLIPYSQTSRPVAANFGDSAAGVKASKLTGSSGTFGVYADAHRRAADMYGETGWNWQSPTWSGIRDVFDKAMKKPQNVAKIEDLWRQVDAGRMSIKEARDEFWKIALEGEKRIPDPDWLRLAPP